MSTPSEPTPPAALEPESEPAGPSDPASGAPRDRVGLVMALLITASAVPLVSLMVPNTISYVAPQVMRDLGVSGAEVAGLVRANGLALPALLLAMPVAAVAARKFPAWAVLLAGLVAVLAGELGAAYASSVPLVGAVRVVEGLGAGLVLPATLVLVWERRRRVLAAAWAGVFVGSLLLTMPLALFAVPPVDSLAAADGTAPVLGDWRTVMRPYPWLLAVALIATALYGLLWLRRRTRDGEQPAGRLRLGERTQLLLPVVPATGFAFLAIVTTYGWSPGAQLVVAALGMAGLLGLAIVGSRDATTGSPNGYAVVAVTVGLVTMPVVAPLAGLLSARSGTDQMPLLPFAVGAGCAVAGAVAVSRVGREAARTGVLVGHGLCIVAVLMFLTTGATSGGWLLTVPMAVLGVGVGVALAASLRGTGVGSALFGLSLCFPGLLTGHLVLGSLQVTKVNAVVKAGGGQEDALVALTAAFRMWLVVAGVLAVVMAGVAAFVSRQRVEKSVDQPIDQAPATEVEQVTTDPGGPALQAG